MMDAAQAAKGKHIILYYKYRELPDVEAVRLEQREICERHGLSGRVLLAGDEGVNGTLAGSEEGIAAYIRMMCEHPVFRMTEEEFKHSWAGDIEEPFPDLNIKVVKEILSTGGAFKHIPIDRTGEGYLNPDEFHKALLERDESTVVIDVRNQRECAIGRFDGSIDPKTKTFADFPVWVQKHRDLLANKKVLMYCTGGIRCELASAYIRDLGVAQDVKHLKGGIHKYMDEFGPHGLWKGKNFVFDRRGAMAAEGEEGPGTEVVGRCLYCRAPWDEFKPDDVCCVCRELVLACAECRPKHGELHCEDHQQLRACYFSNLAHFSADELRTQLGDLEAILAEIAVGKEHKNKRRTLHNQIGRVQARITALEAGHDLDTADAGCRSCGSSGCSGACWGFWGTERSARHQGKKYKKANGDDAASNPGAMGSTDDATQPPAKRVRVNRSQRLSKQQKRAMELEEHAKFHHPPSKWRHPTTGKRVPEPVMRTIDTMCKGRWQGTSLVDVYAKEFSAYGTKEMFRQRVKAGLITVNGEAVQPDYLLKNGDLVRHVVHWHEPPVWLPNERIYIQRGTLPSGHEFFVLDKPASVPSHPCGPYIANSLSVMAEAQEGLEPKSLAPCHRLDKHTSGLLLAACDSAASRYIQTRIQEGTVRKCYVARVQGQFPTDMQAAVESFGELSNGLWSKGDEWASIKPSDQPIETRALVANVLDDKSERAAQAAVEACQRGLHIAVDCPIETLDHAEGVQRAAPEGKDARSVFVGLVYDPQTNTSLVLCEPRTGRTHQLRVHLAYIGFPIANDAKYPFPANGSGPGGAGEAEPSGADKLARFEELVASEEWSGLAVEEAAQALCLSCRLGDDAGLSESQRECQGIWLHALAYSFLRPHQGSPPGGEELAEYSGSHSVPWPAWATQLL